ncbi:MAG: four helix bundle protein [Chloroflexi bacterium]|nr:four helix bundle protein [Chloroflexota bacterium]
MNYEEWEALVPEEITGDALWNVEAYRLALLMAYLGWRDVTKLMHDRRTLSLSDQLYRAIGSISANLAEGYSRSTGRDRARFFEYSLGSARESRDWYYKGQEILGEKVIRHRLELLAQIIRLLLKMIPQQRTRSLHEQAIPYQADSGQDQQTPTLGETHDLLHNIPLP